MLSMVYIRENPYKSDLIRVQNAFSRLNVRRLTIKRLLTGAIALPLLILLILKGSLFLFGCFIMLLSFVGLTEFYQMALPERKPEGLLAAFLGSLLLAPLPPDHMRLAFTLAILVILFALFALFRIKDIKRSAADLGLFLMGILYVPLLLNHLLLLRWEPYGTQWVFLLLVIVMAGDTAAFYVGSALGKRKLYPIVSPNKSVEGALGGLAGSTAGAFIARVTFFPELSVTDCIVTALLVGGLGQLGDLFESLLKRSFGVKDSGVIIPGHGGMLDRLDSILFAAPAAFYYTYFIFMRR
ncbi:MAG: phosphatidate [Geobacteraceae bacterium]|nr:MAG: phosphatidate [Geobacteraceae bacterium]